MDGYWNRHGENSRCVFSSQKNGLKMVVPRCSISVGAWNDSLCQVKLTGFVVLDKSTRCWRTHPSFGTVISVGAFALSTREMKMPKWPYWMRKIASHPLLPVAFVRSKVCWVRVKASASVEWHTKLDRISSAKGLGVFSVQSQLRYFFFRIVFQIPLLKYNCSWIFGRLGVLQSTIVFPSLPNIFSSKSRFRISLLFSIMVTRMFFLEGDEQSGRVGKSVNTKFPPTRVQFTPSPPKWMNDFNTQYLDSYHHETWRFLTSKKYGL